MTSKVQVNLRLPQREASMLKVAAKAYRAPSLNWFVQEMVTCMLNPARWGEFSLRLQSGTVQQTFELGQSVLQDRPRAAMTDAGTRKRRQARGRTARKGRRRV